MNDIVKLAIDGYHGRVEKYSVAESQDLLRKALIEANNGSTVLDIRAIRDGKCPNLFALVETVLAKTVVEGLQGDEFFVNMVEFRNVAEGDQNVFVIDDGVLYVVAETANGTQGVRRQRIIEETDISVPTTFKTVRIYEELNRVLAGRVDFNQLIAKVSESFKQKLLDDIYAAWSNATQAQLGGATYFPAAGQYDEDVLLELVQHVEAASGGKVATLLGTKKALRKIAPAVEGADSKSDLYNIGYYGKFYGSNVMNVPQRHKIGTTTFMIPDDVITIVAGDVKPIKVVYEGSPLMVMGNLLDNADLTQEYFYGDKYGVALVLAGNSGIGRYEFT